MDKQKRVLKSSFLFYNKLFTFKYPTFIQLNVTNVCNLKCKHCFNDSGKESKNNLSDEEIFGILDYFLEKNIVCITFGGGEPLMHKRIYDFINYAYKKGGRLTLLSNGLLLNKKNINRLYESGIYRIRVSLDGSTEEINDFIRSEGSFKGAVRALRNLVDSSIEDVAVMTSVNQFNVNDLENIIKLLIKIGIKDIKFIPTISNGRAEKEFASYILSGNFMKSLLDEKNKLQEKYGKYIHISVDSPLEAIQIMDDKEKLYKCGPCLIGQVFLGVKSNGDIFSCPMLDNIVIGNTRKDDVEDLWKNSSLLNRVRDLNQLKDKCAKCKIKKYCGGGCRAISLLSNGNINSPDPYCWI